ncbi:hypothetical protein HKD37_14G039829 [Glycine soja]
MDSQEISATNGNFDFLVGYSKFLMVDTAAFFFLTSIVSIYLGGLMPQWWKLIRKFLFKVEKDAVYGFRFNDSFKVKRICEDDAIIHEFKNDSVPVTPEKRQNAIENVSNVFEHVIDMPDDAGCDDASFSSLETLLHYKKRLRLKKINIENSILSEDEKVVEIAYFKAQHGSTSLITQWVYFTSVSNKVGGCSTNNIPSRGTRSSCNTSFLRFSYSTSVLFIASPKSLYNIYLWNRAGHNNDKKFCDYYNNEVPMTVSYHVKSNLESIGEGIVGNSTSSFPLSASQAHSVSVEP